MFLQTDPLAPPEVFYGPVSRVNPRRGGRISPWCGWGILVLRFNPLERRRDGEGGNRGGFGNGWLPPLDSSILGRGRWKLRHVAPDLNIWLGSGSGSGSVVGSPRAPRVEHPGSAAGTWSASGESAVVFFSRFYSPSPVERRRAATRGGSRKETLNHRRLAARHAKMAAAPLGFKVPGKACVLPRGARAAALPPSARRPARALGAALNRRRGG